MKPLKIGRIEALDATKNLALSTTICNGEELTRYLLNKQALNVEPNFLIT